MIEMLDYFMFWGPLGPLHVSAVTWLVSIGVL